MIELSDNLFGLFYT